MKVKNSNSDCFDPFFESRFPLYGMTSIQGMPVEIRSAIEPWNVLGEESGKSRNIKDMLTLLLKDYK